MKLLNLIRTSVGGYWIVQELAAVQSRGHEVVALVPDASGPLGDRLRAADIPVRSSIARLGTTAATYTPGNLLALRREMESHSPDVVQYQLIQTALAARLSSVGTAWKTAHRVPGPLYLENPYLALAERGLSRLDDLIICGSDYTAARYRALGVSPDRVAAVPFGLDLARFTPPSERDRAINRQRLGLDTTSKQTVYIMVAYAYPPKRLAFRGRGIKGHETLIEAWSSFSAQHDDVKLIVVGDGFGSKGDTYRRRLERDLLAGSRPGSARWFVGVHDVREYYEAADVSISPSLSENHGAAAEAGAMGIPSIVSNAGALPETIDDASGWVFAAGDADGLLQKLELSRTDVIAGQGPARGRAARALIATKFDSDKCSMGVARLLESLGPS